MRTRKMDTHFANTKDATDWERSVVGRETGRATDPFLFLEWLLLQFLENEERIVGEEFCDAMERFMLLYLEEVDIDCYDERWIWTRVGIQEYKAPYPDWWKSYEEDLGLVESGVYGFRDISDVLALIRYLHRWARLE